MAKSFNAWQELQQFDVDNINICPACDHRDHDGCHHNATYDRCLCAIRGHRCECKHFKDLHHKGVWSGMDVFSCEVCGCPEYSEEPSRQPSYKDGWDIDPMVSLTNVTLEMAYDAMGGRKVK